MNDHAPAQASQSSVQPGLLDLFLAFSGIAMMGFGGVLPWARRMLVEQRRWVTAAEFTEVLSLGQFLPGGNIINVAVVVGGRMRGVAGAVVAVIGLMAAPTVVVILAGALYLRYQDVPGVHGALTGMAAAAVGLIASMGVKMLQPLVAQRAVAALLFVLITFVAVGVFRVSLPLAVLILAPLSVAAAWRSAK
jgi:chromate transporter